VFVVGAALALPQLAADVARQTGLGTAFVGSVLVALTTSLPEIVVSLAAVRLGALDMGVGNVLGSNLFNLFVLGLDDVFYRPGPLLGAVDRSHLTSICTVVAMRAVFLVGLTQRAARKRFVVAWETAAIVVIYAASLWLAYR
jgi:cation:H+ antiporter